MIAVYVILATLPAKTQETMRSIRTEIIIEASKEKVWSVLTDFESYPDWNPFITSIQGEPKEETKLIAKLRLNPETAMTIKPTVMKVTENEEFEWYGTTPLRFFNGRHSFTIEEIAVDKVKLVHAEVFTGWLKGMILKKVGDQTREGFIAMNNALKERAEQ